jgi:hypothetical protein
MSLATDLRAYLRAPPIQSNAPHEPQIIAILLEDGFNRRDLRADWATKRLMTARQTVRYARPDAVLLQQARTAAPRRAQRSGVSSV